MTTGKANTPELRLGEAAIRVVEALAASFYDFTCQDDAISRAYGEYLSIKGPPHITSSVHEDQ